MWSRLTLFAGNSNAALAEKVCSRLQISSGKALITRFSDGEIRVEIGENVRGKDIYVLQSTCPPVNENLMELLVIIDALKRASARRINAIIPYYGYGRQDQKDKPRVPLAAKVVADLLSVRGRPCDHHRPARRTDPGVFPYSRGSFFGTTAWPARSKRIWGAGK